MATVNEYYERYWDAPDSYYDPTTPQRQQLLRRHLAGLRGGSRVLDLGCGRGEFCEFFKSLGFVPEGIDISRQVIEHARSRHPEIAFHAGEVRELLPDRAGSFDCVFSSEVIEHLFDVADYLRAANRLLRPDGLFVLTTPYHGFLKNVMIDALNYAGHYDPLGQHIRFFDRRGLGSCLTKFGFRPFVWTGYGRPWPFWKSFFVVCRKERDVEASA
jgi:2-polyprenyl-6-hydroxyphenyl methylase/3-demethylubiquinone-9 3-methyltransferase